MNYDEHISQLIEALKDDQSLAQPYKNYLISDAKRLQIAIRGAKTIAFNQPPPDMPEPNGTTSPQPMQFAGPSTTGVCVCTPGMPRRRDCPVHGK